MFSLNKPSYRRSQRLYTCICALTAVGLLLITTQCREQPALDIDTYNGMEVRQNQVLIKFRQPMNILLFTLLAREITKGQVEVEQVGGLNVVRITSHDKDVSELIELFNRLVNVGAAEYVRPNHILRGDSLPNDSLFSNLWGLDNRGQPLTQCGVSLITGEVKGSENADINAVDAWPLLDEKVEIVVAVLDTGIDLQHDDLKNALWTATEEFTVTISGETVKCPKGSHGYNALKKRCEDEFIKDNHGHGTEVAGIIGATAGNLMGIAGVSPTVKIMAIKISDAENKCDEALVAAGIEFVRQVTEKRLANVRVLNNSYGLTCPQPPNCATVSVCSHPTLEAAVKQANELGLLFVASAGKSNNNNDCIMHLPSGYDLPNVIAVAASDNQDNLDYAQSNFGKKSVDIAAPGTDICTTARNNRYLYGSGTSLSAAFVSGAAALILTRCKHNITELREHLLENTNLELKTKPDGPIAKGRLDVFRAMTACINNN